MASNYPPGVAGREYAIAGDDEDSCPPAMADLQMEAERLAGGLEGLLAAGRDSENGYQRDVAWWTRNADIVKRLIDAVVAAEAAIEEARTR